MPRVTMQRQALAAIAVVCALRGEASAADAVSLNRFRASPDQSGGFVVGDPRRLANGEYGLSLTLDGATSPAILRRVDGSSAPIVGFRMGASLGLFRGLAKGWSIAADLPLVLGQTGSFEALPAAARPADGTLSHVGLGDLRVTPRWSLLSQARHPVDLRLEAGVVLPTGSTSALAGDGGFGGHAAALVGRRFGATELLGEVGVALRPDRRLLQVDFGSEAFVRVAARHGLPAMGWLKPWAIAELDLSTQLAAPFSSSVTSPVEWRVGARGCVHGPWVVTVADGAGLTGAYGSPTNRFIVAVGQDPRTCPGRSDDAVLEPLPPKDTDADGVPDPDDRCPALAGVPDHQGCPPPVVVADADADGVPDADDRCPQEPGVPALHGCSIDSADRDKDGLSDELDDCPDVAGTLEARGCALVDRDGDAIADDEDLCPSEAGPSGRNGCPVHDRDDDGVEDEQDRCPAGAGDARYLGCLFVDSDQDGVPDMVDNCPDGAGEPENRGCGARQVVAIRHDHIELLEKVKFIEGSAAIEPRSMRVVDQVFSVLKAHPELLRVRIESHVDNVGDASAAKRLTQARANALVRYLLAKGISPERLEASGAGGERPVASNATARGKEENRRVEVRLLPRAKSGDPLDTTTP
jgi:OOP family OmpA-OmpF porin